MRGWWKGVLLAGGAVALCGVLFLVEENLRGQWELRREMEQLAAQGEVMDPAKLAPAASPEALENGRAYLERVEALDEIKRKHPLTRSRPGVMKVEGPGKVRSMVHDPAPESLTYRTRAKEAESAPETPGWEQLAQEVAAYAAITQALRESLASPVAVPTDYTNVSARMHVSSNAMEAYSFLHSEAVLDLHEGRLPAAVANIAAIQRIGQVARSIPTLVEQLVSYAMQGVATAQAWAALQEPGWTDESLGALQAAFADTDAARSLETAVRMERAGLPQAFKELRKEAAARELLMRNAQMDLMGDFFSVMDDDPTNDRESPEPSAFLVWLHSQAWRVAWCWQDEARTIGTWTRNVGLVQRCAEDGYAAVREELPEHFEMTVERLPWRFVFAETLFPAGVIRGPIGQLTRSETQRRLTLTAIALTRHQLAHGEYPAQLGELVPDILPEIPLDPVDNQPLRYRRTAPDAYVLYSIGPDGEDNGGDPAKPAKDKRYEWTKARDVVWPG